MHIGIGTGVTRRRDGAGAVGAPPLGTITVDSASLQFPDGNSVSSSTGAPAYLADATNWAPTGNKIFTPGTDAAFAIMIEVPWEAIQQTAAQFTGICGNRGGGTINQTLGIWAVRDTFDTAAMSIQFFLRDNLGITLTGGVTVTANQRRLLCVMRMSGSQVIFEVYREGALVGSVSPTMSTFAAMQLRSQLLYGAMGSGTGTGYFVAGGFFNHIGSIAWVGYYQGTFTTTNGQNLTLGTDPLVELTAANWRMYRRFTGTDAASLAKPAAATGDATASMTVQNTRSLTFRNGSDLLPARSGANWISANYISHGRVFGRLKGASTGRIFLSGSSSGLTGGVEARVFDAATGQLTLDWTAVTGATLGGAWSGYVDAPKNNGWGHIDIRAAATPSLVQRIRARTGVGQLLGVLGQSQIYRCWQYPTAIASTPTAALSSIYVTSRSAATWGLAMTPITAERPWTESLAYLSAWLTAKGITEPVMLMGLCNPGQGIAQLVNDGDTGWNWSELEATLTKASGPLAERRITAVAINWVTNFANDVGLPGNGIIGNHIRPLIEGARDAGATTTFTINHYIRDGLTFNSGMVLALSPIMRYAATVAGPFDFGGQDTAAANHGTGRAQWLTYQQANSPTIMASEIGPSTADVAIETAGGPHELITGAEGHPRFLARLVEATLRASGLISRTNPSLGSAAIDGGRTTITITPNLPNGGSLQTAWAIKSVAVPGGETTVQGFEVQNGGAGAWTRSGFTAEIVAGKAVLTKSAGSWSAGTKVSYAVNGPLDFGTTSNQASLYNGLLYESGADEGGLGIPLNEAWTATV